MSTSMVPVPVTPLNALSNPLNTTVELSFDNISEQLFKKVENCVYDLRTYRLGVLRASRDSYAVFVPGEVKVVNEQEIKTPAELQVCPVAAFGLPIPAYAIRTPITDLKPGDVVIITGHSSDTWLYFLKAEKSVEFKNPSLYGIRVEDGVKIEVTLSESLYAPGDNVLCVRNVFSQKNDLTKMLPMLALLGAGGRGEEGREKLSKLILCMLMGQSGGESGTGLDMKSMLPMLMLGGGGDNMLMTAMMLQNGGGIVAR
jgi:hypothetical protein